MKFAIKDFFSKSDQIRRKLWIWSHLLKKSLMENFTFRAVFLREERVNPLFSCLKYYFQFNKKQEQLEILYHHYIFCG